MPRPPHSEPWPGEYIQILSPSGEPSDTHTRVKSVLSHDRHEDLWEVVDSLNQTRIITAAAPNEWLEVLWPSS